MTGTTASHGSMSLLDFKISVCFSTGVFNCYPYGLEGEPWAGRCYGLNVSSTHSCVDSISSTQHGQGLIQDIRKQIIKYIILYQSEERPALLGSSFDSPGAMETSVNVVLITPLE